MPEGEDGKGTAFFVRHGESTSNDRNVFAGVCRAPQHAYGVPCAWGQSSHLRLPVPHRACPRRAQASTTCTSPSTACCRPAAQARCGRGCARAAVACRQPAGSAAAAIRPPRGRCSTALTRAGALQDIARRGTKFDAIFVSHMRRARQTCQLVMEECDPDCTLPHQIDHRLAEKSFGIFAGRNINVLRMVRGTSVTSAPQPLFGACVLTRPLRRRCTASRRSSA